MNNIDEAVRDNSRSLAAFSLGMISLLVIIFQNKEIIMSDLKSNHYGIPP